MGVARVFARVWLGVGEGLARLSLGFGKPLGFGLGFVGVGLGFR